MIFKVNIIKINNFKLYDNLLLDEDGNKKYVSKANEEY